MTAFDHEKLDAYNVTIQALAFGVQVARGIPREDSFLRNQLLRALTSMCFNLAEGSGEFSAGDKVRSSGCPGDQRANQPPSRMHCASWDT